MRACARVALASIAVSASFSLSGCAAIEELKETFLRWVESEKLPSGRGVFAYELPKATPVVPPEKTPKEPSKRHPQPKDAARKLQRQTVVSPWENGYIESFNARLPDELLDGAIFYSLREARIVIESWRRHYNTIRPHASLGYKPPAPEVFVPKFDFIVNLLTAKALRLTIPPTLLARADEVIE